MREDAITSRIIACAIKVHQTLGPGLLESSYQIGLEEEFKEEKLQFRSQLALPLIYNGRRTKKGYKAFGSSRWPDPELQLSLAEKWDCANRQSCVPPLS
jgi:hypothetical protein